MISQPFVTISWFFLLLPQGKGKMLCVVQNSCAKTLKVKYRPIFFFFKNPISPHFKSLGLGTRLLYFEHCMILWFKDMTGAARSMTALYNNSCRVLITGIAMCQSLSCYSLTHPLAFTCAAEFPDPPYVKSFCESTGRQHNKYANVFPLSTMKANFWTLPVHFYSHSLPGDKQYALNMRQI